MDFNGETFGFSNQALKNYIKIWI